MARLSADQINRELGSWLRDESVTRAPVGLVEDVFARTSRTRQVRSLAVPSIRLRSRNAAPHLVGSAHRPSAWRGPLLAAAVGVVLVAVAVALAFPRGHPGPAASGVADPSTSPSPPARASVPGSATGSPTPEPTTLSGLSARRLALGGDSGPISVIEAFGSIWVADIHANDVRRIEPLTMREIARIAVPGAAWFAVADGALWVTQQTGTGLSRIDPATNTVVAHVGDVPPCGAPVNAFGGLWQSACDADVFLRIDPAQNRITDTIPARGRRSLVLSGDRLISVGTDGLARLDPESFALTSIPTPAAIGGFAIGGDADSVWVQNSAGVARIDPADGRSIGGISAPGAGGLFVAGDHAWLAVGGVGVEEIDIETYRVVRTIEIASPMVTYESGSVLWVTDFERSDLWRIDL